MALDEAKTFNTANTEGDVNLKLQLSDKELNLEELEALMKYPKIKRVRFLGLNANEFWDEGVEVLARSPSLARLHSLSLAQNKITDRGLKALPGSDFG